MNAITKQVPAIIQARLPCDAEAAKKYGIEPGQWRVLVESVWPSAKTADAVFLAIDYCKARNLDPFKRPCHIVPMWNSTLGREVETVWPGISDIRTTAARTGEYAGTDETVFGDEVTETFTGSTKRGEKLDATVTFPSWAKVTVYRIVKGQRVPFPGPRVMWKETYSQTKGTPVPNARWCRAPVQMLEKCAEAAALRKAFPEELGSVYAAEEMEGRPIEADAVSYTDVREEARFIIAEMDSCPNRQRLDEYFGSASVKEFMMRAEGAATNKPSSINQADVVTQFYHQIRDRLHDEPEQPFNPMNEQDAAQSSADVAPAATSQGSSPESSQDGGNEPAKAPAAPPQGADAVQAPPESSLGFALGETASRILDMIDIAETAADMKAISASATKAKEEGELTAEEAEIIQRAYKAKRVKLKEAA